MIRSTRTIALLVVISFAPSLSARADEEPAIRVEDARARFNEGRERYKRGDYEGARSALTQAYSVLREPNILIDLSAAELKSGHARDGLRHLREYAALPNVPASVKEKLPTLIKRAEQQTGHIRFEVPPGTSVSVDDEPLPVPLPDVADVEPGSHVVVALVGGKDEQRQVVAAAAGELVPVRFEARPFPQAQQPPGQVITEPGAQSTLSPGDAAPSRSFWNTRNTLSLALAVGAVGTLAAGIGFELAAQDQENTLNGLHARTSPGSCTIPTNTGCAALVGARDSQQSDARLGAGFYVASGVLAAGAIATWFALAPRSPSTAISPSVAPGYAGMQLVSTF